MTHYKIIISSIWWVAGLAILVLFLWITADPNVFAGQSDKAIDWVIPHLVPTMTLTGAVAFVQPRAAREGRPGQQTRHAFMLTVLISVVYLLILSGALVLALTSSTVESQHGVIDNLYSWNKILGVVQGLAASAIGVFFVRSGDNAGGARDRTSTGGPAPKS